LAAEVRRPEPPYLLEDDEGYGGEEPSSIACEENVTDDKLAAAGERNRIAEHET